MRLENKVAIITGAGGGLGSETIKLFAKEGAKVVATDLVTDHLEAVVKEINEAGGEAIAVKHNVASADDWKNVVDQAVAKFGTVDILVNNAGIADKSALSTAETVEEDEWERVMNVNLKSVYLGMKQVLPIMREHNTGSIVNISSIAAIIGTGGPFAYTSTKGGIRSMTKSVAAAYGQFGIRANSVHPGAINTKMTAASFENDEGFKDITQMIPLRRISEPAEIAQVVLFLASDDASYVSGSEYVVDGGATIV
ncbi:glucose 1-dehydrogenase [Aerococcus agrisoli]|uniref:Glucose 1-dehydrogenase n=1 Tax=Aerococcus agrisoli TaxID=2487350 RepID=A0A3N4HCQ4_9LACT|nr:glucose 1-dehydrogenase [Aerococcus agrisoli]RPA63684.1 glucose 1-dehydrogenase [Aerococcus agrisoli]